VTVLGHLRFKPFPLFFFFDGLEEKEPSEMESYKKTPAVN